MFRTLSVSALFLLCLSLINWSCTKIDSTAIGADLIPAVDNVTTFDTTLSVIATNIDSSATDCFTVYPGSYHELGYVKDNPLFGTTIGTIYTELKSPVYPFNFPANSTLDSVVLVLGYTASWGDTTQQQKVNVYQIADAFNPDSSSCRSYPYNPVLLGSAIYTPQLLDDSVFGFNEASAGELRIRLTDAFANYLFSQDSSGAFKSDSIFKTYFHGFAITPDLSFGGNAISYFNLADTNTKLAFYYKTTNTTIDTTVYNFRLSALSASANYVVRNHTGSELAAHLTQPAAGDDQVYIQTSPGTSAKIKIPGLANLSNRIVHRAVLTMDEIYSNDPAGKALITPNILYIDLKDSLVGNGYLPVPCDVTASSGTPDLTLIGGSRRIVKDANGNDISRYTFNISRYVQKIVTNKRTSAEIRVRAPADIINTATYTDDCLQGVIPFNYPINLPAYGQVKLGGGNNASYRMKLQIIYSKL